MATDRELALRFLRPPHRDEGLPPLASELGHGVLRHRNRLDWVVERASGRKREVITPAVLDVLRLGAYQILFTASVPPYAAVSESVDLAKKVAPRAAGFVNWCLRRVGAEARDLPRREEIADPLLWLETRYSFPRWLVERWAGRFGPEEAEELCAAMNLYPALDLRVNLARCTRGKVAGELRAAGGEVAEGSFSSAALHVSGIRGLTALPAFREGRVYIQDESSQLAALALAPRPGERVLDACAGLGGKSTHLVEITGGGAEVVAVDSDGRRLALMGDNLRRLGLRGVVSLRGDILSPDTALEGPFDGILLDAPCSSLGIIRRHPEVKWLKRAADIPRFAALQLRLLESVSPLLAPGGRLVYSTCTTEPEENEGVVDRFMEGHREFRAIVPGEEPAAAATHGEAAFGALLDPRGFLRPLPHRHGINGGFVALLRRE